MKRYAAWLKVNGRLVVENGRPVEVPLHEASLRGLGHCLKGQWRHPVTGKRISLMTYPHPADVKPGERVATAKGIGRNLKLPLLQAFKEDFEKAVQTGQVRGVTEVQQRRGDTVNGHADLPGSNRPF